MTWVNWFGLSKLAELGDTIFVILRKRPLTFLHVYHHSTVLLFTWYLCAQVAPVGRWFSTMNLFIHSIMYSYYALQALRWFRIPKRLALTITLSQVKSDTLLLSKRNYWILWHIWQCFFLHQIAQMIIGFAVNLYAFQCKRRRQQCDLGWEVIFFSFVIYGSYLVLFLIFFVKAYLTKPAKDVRKTR